MAAESDKYTIKKYLAAMRIKKYKDAIDILDEIIKETPVQEKEALISCITYRIVAFHKNEQYEMVIKDCVRLKELGIEIEDDDEISCIYAEAQLRITITIITEQLERTAIKCKAGSARLFHNRIQSINLEKLFTKKDAASGQTQKRKK